MRFPEAKPGCGAIFYRNSVQTFNLYNLCISSTFTFISAVQIPPVLAINTVMIHYFTVGGVACILVSCILVLYHEHDVFKILGLSYGRSSIWIRML